MANTSILAAFERMWQHTVAALGNKANADHTHAISDVTELQTTLDTMNESIEKLGAPDIPTTLPNPNTLTINGTSYDGSTTVDYTETINNMINAAIINKQEKITGTAGQFVIIGDDGNVTTITLPNAEEASF